MASGASLSTEPASLDVADVTTPLSDTSDERLRLSNGSGACIGSSFASALVGDLSRFDEADLEALIRLSEETAEDLSVRLYRLRSNDLASLRGPTLV